MKHTQGTWMVVKWGDGALSVDSDCANTVARINDAGPETLPNANLIAAAPEMLGVCRMVAELPEDNFHGCAIGEAIRAARAALAKVGGGNELLTMQICALGSH